MNKESLIKQLKDDVVRADDCLRNQKVIPVERVKRLVNQLDEPEKPVVPKCVADWFEENKHSLERKIYAQCAYIHSTLNLNEFQEWLSDFENNTIETLIKMKLFGYKVEKEKLYYVRMTEEFADQLSKPTRYTYLNRSKETGKSTFDTKIGIGEYQTKYSKKEAEDVINNHNLLDLEMVEVEDD